MGVDVIVMRVTQTGTSPKGRRFEVAESFPDVRDVFATLCGQSRLPMLRRVDPYGSLVLTPEEMPQLIAELTETLALAGDDPARRAVEEVRRLAERCATEPGLELHLEGD
ncbi:hypothetical protein FDA94_24425 [Herbidospora galbida]|uniref:Uncharacterized protein n=1 Tax=Herbidospora galbida TaxID=2575442 RepID=A0A4V5UZ22_9ACTN|nr:hypothetical protein [Herbidospora galbida]TKK85783.1 hypothetical protein FDA94_24425 [Herbidospora galbida]